MKAMFVRTPFLDFRSPWGFKQHSLQSELSTTKGGLSSALSSLLSTNRSHATSSRTQARYSCPNPGSKWNTMKLLLANLLLERVKAQEEMDS